MRPLHFLAALLLALALAAGAALWLQRQATAELRSEIAQLREDGRELARLRAENQRLAAALPPAAEMDRLRADRAAVVSLRNEIEKTRDNLVARERALREPVGSRDSPAPPPRPGAPTDASLAPLPPLRSATTTIGHLHLPDADIETAFKTIEMLAGWRISRDGTLGRGVINLRDIQNVTNAQAIDLLRVALRDQVGILLEPLADGTVAARRAVGR